MNSAKYKYWSDYPDDNDAWLASLLDASIAREDRLTIVRLKRLLATSQTACVKCECFNEAEATIIRQHLTDDEKARTSFSWLTFGAA
jgi:hypothetical protein